MWHMALIAGEANSCARAVFVKRSLTSEVESCVATEAHPGPCVSIQLVEVVDPNSLLSANHSRVTNIHAAEKCR